MNNQKIDNQKKVRMYSEIRALESMNLRTKKYSETEMIREIEKIIARHVQAR